jgi:gamma-glutamyltranspeptidase/glutathione hydrolase
VDGEGNVTAVTSTINLPFGAGYTAAGMVMNDEMDDFARGIGLENAYGLPGAATNLPGPGRRPVSTMSPTIILNERGPLLCLGASGGSRIVTAIQQVVLNHLVLGLPLPEAVAAPRIHHQGLPDILRSEESTPLDPSILEALLALGHEHQLISNVAVVQAIGIHSGQARRLVAVSDPRKGGQPRGR